MKTYFTGTGRGIHQAVRLTLFGVVAAVCATIAYWYGLVTGTDATVAKQLLAEHGVCAEDESTTQTDAQSAVAPEQESADDILFAGCGGFF